MIEIADDSTLSLGLKAHSITYSHQFSIRVLHRGFPWHGLCVHEINGSSRFEPGGGVSGAHRDSRVHLSITSDSTARYRSQSKESNVARELKQTASPDRSL
jgi:hypothetical protein